MNELVDIHVMMQY